MSSTQLKVTNNSDIPIKAVLVWGASEIGTKDIGTGGQTGGIGCEYVWYDLRINNNNINTQVAMENGVYGDSSWNFAGSATGGYSLLRT
jgi:hypothetical protein